MARLNIPVGVSDFEKIQKNGYYYIDKSSLITEVLKKEVTGVTLLTRPRRFGKTLAMSMLASFFDIRKQSQELFGGLAISSYPDLCQKWMNQFPTLFLSFKDVNGATFERAFEMLKFTLSQLCIEHAYLLANDEIDDGYKEIFEKLKNQTASITDVKGSFLVMMKMMQIHYKKPVILLLDEYDVPLSKASGNCYYQQMLEIIKAMMSTALKDNTALQFAVVTGCLKVSKESIFTGTNNFVSDTISKTRLQEYFGFTESDVKTILKDCERVEQAEKIKKWYDGYHFGEVDVYCPWDVMNYIYDLQLDPEALPSSYWRNTSDNAIIRSFIDYKGNAITMKLETLMSGGYIQQRIEEGLTYDYLHSSEDHLWSVLYLTGYLTKVKDSDLPKNLREQLKQSGKTALIIPNLEIQEIFKDTIIRWFDDSVAKWDCQALFQAVWSGDSVAITREMTTLLRMTISYHDYREDFYHAFLAGIFTGAGYLVESNKEHGEGRSDVVVFDSRGGRVAIFEAKYSKSLEKMQVDCERALQQIDDRQYAEEFEDNYDHVFCYAISFFKKRCLVKVKI